jgi:hypothetical protein
MDESLAFSAPPGLSANGIALARRMPAHADERRVCCLSP